MFSKAARFVPDKDNGVPGPGAYNPNTEYLEPNKLGAVVDKADRFKKVKPSDIPGPGTYNTTRSTQDPALTSLKQQLRTLQAQLTRLEKDRARDAEQYESKIAQAELRAQELVKEKSVLQSEAAIADKERRAATQREATLRAAMEKSEAALKNLNDKGSKLGSLQRKLEDLEKVHAEGKKRVRSFPHVP
ncbi:hypothetical protein BOTBODRAFT_205114 [Botryobasidium botryosum FD-172 SS1]|uniref:Uncharacterized protein n=1 Tax=Botryobasidium botryosum (strain FD-172 SS1) TaxID=930990 RepID=A0A067N3F8_BOTB1|nr:hypothetical protein BOTBODRAFT_205114 [Botryobasidium botryosum FD-172 SS1]